MQELMGMFPEELREWMAQRGEKAFRADQVFAWLHKGASFDEMSNLSAALREKLKNEAVDQPVQILSTRVSKLDGTRKYLFSLRDGNCVEGVLMRYEYGCTLCISTQVGCRMGCRFCASTLDGCVRNLTAAEMLGEVQCANRDLNGEKVHNIVLMGSGEPLDNYDHVVRFLRLVSHEKGLNIGLRHISLSTCGLVPQIGRFAAEGLPVTLSISLHAPNDTIRKQIMPVANTWPIGELMQAVRSYVADTGRRVVFEYALIDKLNSTPEHAKELARLIRGLQCHVNLIPLNYVEESPLIPASPKAVQTFLATLEAEHISATVRREMGSDIGGACGQLRRRHLEGKA